LAFNQWDAILVNLLESAEVKGVIVGEAIVPAVNSQDVDGRDQSVFGAVS